MSLLDRRGMNRLRTDFEKRPQGLTLEEFVQRIILRLPDPGISDIELVARLQDLFHQVDVNGDKHMDWQEFSNFCVEAGVAASNMSSMEITEKYIQRSFIDSYSHSSEILQIKFVPELNKLFVCEAGSQTIKVYDPQQPELVFLQEINLADAVMDQSEKRNIGCVLAIEYLVIGSRKLLAISATNMTITLWDAGIYDVAQDAVPRFLERIIVDKPQFIIRHVPFMDSLFTAAADNKVIVHTVRHIPKIEVKEICTLRRHTDLIQDILSVDELEVVVTAAMDCKIFIWGRDPTQPVDKQILWKSHRSGHQKGVRSLAYAEGGLLLSAAFDLVVLAWDITEISMRPVFQLLGHTSPLFGVRILPSKQHAVTLDTRGVFKTWDIRREGSILDSERNVQTFTIGASLDSASKLDEDLQFAPCALEVVTPSGTLFAAKNRMLIFETAQLKPEKFAPSACVYNPTSITIACAIHRDVKIWDARTAELLCHFQNIMESDITSLKLDFRNRKFITADQKGNVTTFNYLNGSYMKDNSSDPHAGEVSCMVYGSEDKVIVTGSWDKSIRIYNETLPNQLGPLRRIVGAHKGDIGALALAHSLSLIASADETGMIRVWDFQFLALEGEMFIDAPVAMLAFLDPYPLLLSVQRSGLAHIWPVRPFATNTSLHRHCCATKFNLCEFMSEEETISCAELIAPGVHGSKSGHYLYAGTTTGRVIVLDLKATILSLKIAQISHTQQASQRENYNPYRKLQRVMENQNATHPANIMLQPNIKPPRKIATWLSHERGVSSLQVLQDPDSVLTCGGDKAIRLWSRAGHELGCLDANERKALQVARVVKIWNFPIDMESRRKRELADAQKLVNKILKDIDPNEPILQLHGFKNDQPQQSFKGAERRRFTTILTQKEESEQIIALQEKKAMEKRQRERQARAALARQLNAASSTEKLHNHPETESEPLNVLDAVVEGDDDGMTVAERERKRVLGQLEGKRTWKKTQQEIAQEAAEAQAQERERKLKTFSRKMSIRRKNLGKSKKRKGQGKKKKKNDQQKHQEGDAQKPGAGKEKTSSKQKNDAHSNQDSQLQNGAVGPLDPTANSAGQLGKLHLYDNLRAELERLETKDKGGGRGLGGAHSKRKGELDLEPPTLVKKHIEELNFAAKVSKRHVMSAPLLRGVGQGAQLSLNEDMLQKTAQGSEQEALGQSRETGGIMTGSSSKPETTLKNSLADSILDEREDQEEIWGVGHGSTKGFALEGLSWRYVANKVKSELQSTFGTPTCNVTKQKNVLDIENELGQKSIKLRHRSSLSSLESKSSRLSRLSNRLSRISPSDQDAVIGLYNGNKSDGRIDMARKKREEEAAARLEQARSRLEERKSSIIQRMQQERQQRMTMQEKRETQYVQQRAKELKASVKRALEPTKEQLRRIRQARYLGPFLKQDVSHIRELFRSLDGDNNGAIDLREFQHEVKRTSSDSGNFRSLLDQSVSMFRSIDQDRSGSIQIDELARVLFNKATAKEMDDILVFLHLPPPRKRGQLAINGHSSMISRVISEECNVDNDDNDDDEGEVATSVAKSTRNTRAEIRALFDLYDTNRDNELTIHELEAAIHENGLLYSSNDHHQMDRGLERSDLDDFVAALNLDANKTVSFEEFYSFFIDKWEA